MQLMFTIVSKIKTLTVPLSLVSRIQKQKHPPTCKQRGKKAKIRTVATDENPISFM